MDFEEIVQGRPEDAEPAGLGLATWAAIGAVVLLAGALFLTFSGPPEPAAAPQPDTSGRASLAAMVGPPEKLGIGRICPARADRPHQLDVSFTLVNNSPSEITVMDVSPAPAGVRLRPRGPNTAGGSCEEPEDQAPGGRLWPGATQLVTLHFRVPGSCPDPDPAPVRIRLRVTQMIGTTRVPVVEDLGAIEAHPCALTPGESSP